ncbi:GETHR pentapeptide repeat-containing protein [Acidimicrobium ferrooxidans DSM 10331]|uniref:GETHR pentapeptide repeat-containing protein n=1 Tax=Acidimicrobium ferrooxidans (strain DSM 10331 / JCM 15462 / NBRC 103882 / ICP) TaxID=525909 RepID=C7M014_ACIFD|nr:pentapeptide repeat-containing protein [Acidimicrobium ferrooxidans]ACU54322.1 GETHR pentapeptide repeat-containing protein [Acidimicrobium ferrooxidans DSM 10331]
MRAQEVANLAAHAGYSLVTLKRAKSALRVRSIRRAGEWWWGLDEARDRPVLSVLHGEGGDPEPATDATLRGSTLRGSTLRGSTLRGSTLRGSTLRGSSADDPLGGEPVELEPPEPWDDGPPDVPDRVLDLAPPPDPSEPFPQPAPWDLDPDEWASEDEVLDEAEAVLRGPA